MLLLLSLLVTVVGKVVLELLQSFSESIFRSLFRGVGGDMLSTSFRLSVNKKRSVLDYRACLYSLLNIQYFIFKSQRDMDSEEQISFPIITKADCYLPLLPLTCIDK